MSNRNWWGKGCVAFVLCAATTVASTQTFKSISTFNGATGVSPQYMSLIQVRDGNFAGTTAYDGTDGYGTAFGVTPRGILRVLDGFNGDDGANPFASLVLATDGNV